MRIGIRNITIEQGTTFSMPVELQRGGVAWNVTGYTHSAKIYQGETAVATITVTVVNATTGLLELVVSATQSALLKAGQKYYWRYYATTGATVYGVLGGEVIVTAGMP
jgi:hypothetical protein